MIYPLNRNSGPVFCPFLKYLHDFSGKIFRLDMKTWKTTNRLVAYFICIRFHFYVTALHWLLVTLAVIGKTCASTGFEVLYIFSSELFPTVVRNVGMGSSSAFARAGSMLSPYIAQMVSLLYYTSIQNISTT